MKNNELIPFERNRYYAGKMLTSSDFLAEQVYHNNKRRFVNKNVFGSGIICGCGVFGLDDLSILVESGAAIDGMGREIVIDSSVVKKLSTIAGFENLKSDRACLCLRYKEDDVHAVYTVNRQDGEMEYENNRISEGYALFLVDACTATGNMNMEAEFYAGATLLDCPDYHVELKLPATVCAGKYVKVAVNIEKISDEDAALSYDGVFQMPAFADADGRHELKVEIESLSLKQGEKTCREYWMKAQEEVVESTSVMLKNGSTHAFVNDMAVPAADNVNVQIAVLRVEPEELAIWESNKLSLEMREMEVQQDFVRLAEIDLVRTETAYVIEKIEERSVKKYIPTIAGERKTREYMRYFKEGQPQPPHAQESRQPDGGSLSRRNYGQVPEIETGILEIPLNASAKKGDIRYSGEIMHGLGKGNVYVEVGYERIETDERKTTIYGNPNLFKQDGMPDVCVETAVKVLNDKGSFVVAVKFLKDVDFLILTFRWVALKFPNGNDIGILEDVGDKSISAETPTIVLGAKESYFFNVQFHNMKTCSLGYELTEPGSGEVSPDGIYTAPAKEGVYEMRIYCTDMPMICTYVYAIVKKKQEIES